MPSEIRRSLGLAANDFMELDVSVFSGVIKITKAGNGCDSVKASTSGCGPVNAGSKAYEARSASVDNPARGPGKLRRGVKYV